MLQKKKIPLLESKIISKRDFQEDIEINEYKKNLNLFNLNNKKDKINKFMISYTFEHSDLDSSIKWPDNVIP